MKRYGAAIVVLLTFLSARAQTITPVIQECGKRCSGEFTIQNNGLAPINVMLDAYSFTIDPETKKSVLRPLDSSVELRLDATSARLGPKSDHIFGYRMLCSALPCSVTIYASLAMGRTDNGLLLMVRLPEVIYQCEKAKNCRTTVRKAYGVVD